MRKFADTAIGLIVVICGSPPIAGQVLVQGSQTGQGIPWDEPGRRCLVVTAGHVVKDMSGDVEIRGADRMPTVTEVLREYPEDVALLGLKTAEGTPCKPWSVPRFLERVLEAEDKARVQMRSADGSLSTIPVTITGRDDRWIRVQPEPGSQGIMQSLSGSPVLIGEQLVGIVLAVKGGTGRAFRADRLEELIRNYGKSTPSVERLGRRAQLDSNGWAEIVVSDVDYLPPLPDTGRPDYKLKGETGKRPVFRVSLSEGQPTRTWVRASDLLAVKDVTLSLVEEDAGPFSVSEEAIVEQIILDTPTLLRGPRLKLDVLDALFEAYPNLDRSRRTIRLSLSVSPMDADHLSGPDNSPATPTLIKGGVVRGSINVGAGDATDHVQIEPANGGCFGVVWLRATSSVDLSVLEPAGGATHRRLLGEKVGFPGGVEEVWLLQRNDGQPLLARLSATDPEVNGTYLVFGSADSGGGTSVLAFLETWLKENLSQEHMFFFEGPRIGKVIGMLSAEFSVSASAVLRILERYAHGPALTTVFAILDSDPARYQDAAQKTTGELTVAPLVLAVLSAERREVAVNKAVLARAVESAEETLAIRAIRAVGNMDDVEYVERTLAGRFGDKREAVASEALAVLRRWRSEHNRQ